jgi:hypothetical protein
MTRYLQRGAAGCTSSRRLHRPRTLGRLFEVAGALTSAKALARARALQAKGTIRSRVGGGGCLKKPGVSEKGPATPDVFTQKFTPIPFLHLKGSQLPNAPNTRIHRQAQNTARAPT